MCVCSPGMLSHCYLQTSVACSRQTPGVFSPRLRFGRLFTHICVFARLGRGRRYSRPSPLVAVGPHMYCSFSLEKFHMELLHHPDGFNVFTSVFGFFFGVLLCATVAREAQLPAATDRYSSNGTTTTSSTRCSRAGASICRALTSDIWRTG